MNRHSTIYCQTMDDLNSNAAELMLPPPIRRRLRGFFMNTKAHSRRSTWNQIVGRLSPFLRMEVSYHCHKVWLRRVSFLVGAPKLFLSNLTDSMDTFVYAAQETFGSNFTLYTVSQGVISRARGHLSVLTAGGVWGEEHLLLTAHWLLQENTAHSLTFSEVLTLARKDFDLAVHEFPEVQPRMRKHFIWTAVVRGIIYESKLRLQRQPTRDLARTANAMFGAKAFGSERSTGSGRTHYHENLRQRRNSRMECKSFWRQMTPGDGTEDAPEAAHPRPSYPQCSLTQGSSRPSEAVAHATGPLSLFETRVLTALASSAKQQSDILTKLDDLTQHVRLLEAQCARQ